MASDGYTWRDHPLEVGKNYQPRASFVSARGSSFVQGHRYELLRIAYSYYDGMSVFIFADAGGVSHLIWDWFDNEPDNLPAMMFEQ